MEHFSVKSYQNEDYAIWNSFVETAKNATFLFHRDFMEYHSDRFDDYSLLIFEKTNLIAILPANRVGETVFSHQGLTYGGLVLSEKTKLIEVISIFKSVLVFLNENKISKLNLKMMPSFYCDFFTEELNYCLFLLKAICFRCDTYSVINLQKNFKISKGRRESISKGIRTSLQIKEESNFELFWNEILIPNMNAKHKVKPTHSLNEIELLHKKFPENIRQFNVYHDDKIIAGTTVFETKNVAHPQHISGNSVKNKTGSLDYLYHYLMTTVFKDKKFFDFGNSNEQQGQKLNEGLLFWKESFGAKTVVQSFYELETKNYILLENILI